jgi:streptomycin 6-kinase
VPRAALTIPAGLAWWREEPGGAEWLARLPRLAAECAEEWRLELEAPFESHISLVVAARREDGSGAVLKLNFPEPESEHEPDALERWSGDGAVYLLERDDERRAVLVERCVPGTSLWDEDDETATEIAADLLPRLWRPAERPFRPLADEARRWADELPLRGSDPRLVDEAVAFLREAVDDPGPPVLLHQDFHGGNVLRAEREPWLVIDPKPLSGEREFDAASLLRDRREVLDAPTVRRRFDFLAERLELDRERMRGWGIAHALAWGHEESSARLIASLS